MTQLAIGRINSIKGRIRGQQQLSRSFEVPASVGGINRIQGLTLMPETDALELRNLTANSLGISVRPGYGNYAINMGGSILTDVRTVMGFTDNSEDITRINDRLFAVTDQGIYDITSGSANNPTLMNIYDGFGSAVSLGAGWVDKGGNAGWCSFAHFTTAATIGGKHYLLVCDSENGYHIYDPTTGRWYKINGGVGAGQMEGLDPTDLVHVCVWKSRLFFTEKNSSTAWFLPPGLITGTGGSAPASIDMGSRFIAGGHLNGCYTWTYDGGAGIDDMFVAIGSAGDVVVWQGISPESDDWQIKGAWSLGQIPRGRRTTAAMGGDLLISCSLGIIPISKLVTGGGTNEDSFITYKIQPLVRDYFKNNSEQDGWSVTDCPSQGLMIVNAPRSILPGVPVQLVLSSQMRSWSVWTDIPARCWESWHGQEFIGTDDGRVVILQDSTDTLQEAANTFTDEDIAWTCLTSYQHGGVPANWKRIHLIRPLFVSSQLPYYNVAIQFDFATDHPLTIDSTPVTLGSLWDVALWDTSLWGGDLVVDQPLKGNVGMGRYFAVSLSGRSRFATSVVGFTLIADVGGML